MSRIRMTAVSERFALPASIQEQEARFEAITSKMSMQVQDLEKQLQKDCCESEQTAQGARTAVGEIPSHRTGLGRDFV